MSELTLSELAFFVAVASLIVKGMTMAVDYAVSKTKAGSVATNPQNLESKHDHEDIQRMQTQIIEEIKAMGVRHDKLLELTRDQMEAQKAQYDAINHRLELMDKTLAKKDDIRDMLNEQRR